MESKSKFSVLVIVLNEEDNLKRSLPALMQVSDDVVIADSNSTDGTVSLAQEMGARVEQVEWQGYAATKNLGNSLCKYEWILSIDADEVLSEDLIVSLQELRVSPGTVYALDRLTNYCGTWIKHSGWYPEWKIRLFEKSKVRWQGDYVHETLEIPSGFKTVRLRGHLLHYSFVSEQDHLNRIEKYALLSAQQMYANGKKIGYFKASLAPAARFIRTYILKAGFRDGAAGWKIANNDAHLVRRKYSLLKTLQNKNATQ